MTIKIEDLFADDEVDNLLEAVKDRLGDNYIIVEEENHIPKSKFETVRQEKQDIKEQLDERDNQLEDLKKKAEGNEELENTIENLQEKNKDLKDEFEQKIKERTKEMAIENKLIAEKARNPKAVKALINKEAVTVEDNDGDIKIMGLDEQLEEIKKNEDYLFGETGLKGKDPEKGGKSTKVTDNNPFKDDDINLAKQAEIINEDPDKARKLIKDAGRDPANYNL